MKTLIFLLLYLNALLTFPCYGQTKAGEPVPEVEWYPPEIERGRTPDHSKVIISGRTQPGSLIHMDGDSVTILRGAGAAPPAPEKQEVERQLRIRCKVYESPDMHSHALGAFKAGAVVQTTEYSSSWLKVSVPTKAVYGYMSSPCFLPARESPAATTSAAPPKFESRETHANAEGFFEMTTELPQGLIQMAILVVDPARAQKTFLISVDVNVAKEDIHMNNTKVSTNKPPAAAKKIRLWGGLGFTYQTFSQSSDAFPSLSFQTVQAPGIVARGGYWGDQWGMDLYFRDAPGKVEASAPLQVDTDTYHWRTMEAKGLYQIPRKANSRIWGLPSQWQIRFGAQLHQVPFADVNSNVATLQQVNLTMGTLGIGLLLGQEQNWSYEFALGLQDPLATNGPGTNFSISSPFGYEAQVGAAYKFAPNWRLGLFSYTQSVSYNYSFVNSLGSARSGAQHLFYTTLDLRLGYEY